MRTGSAAGDFGPGLFDVLSGVGGMLGKARGAVRMMTAGHGPGCGGGPRDHGPWRTKGPGPWAAGFGGPWGRWWAGPPGQHTAPGWSRGPKVSRGDVRAGILALLREGPRNGYQIMAEIEERSGGAWRPSPGAVYPALQQLADEGLIAGEESGSGRTYHLTDAGRSYIQDNPDMARGPWESMAQQGAGQLPGLLAQAARLGGGIMQMAHAGTPEQIRAAEQLLDQTRRRLYQILAEDTDGEDDGGGEQVEV